MRSLLLRKQILNMLKRFEFNGVAGRVEEKHGGLLAGFVFEADVGFDDEFGAGGLHAIGEFIPSRTRLTPTKLLHQRHPALRDEVVANQWPSVAAGIRREVDAADYRWAGDAERDAGVDE